MAQDPLSQGPQWASTSPAAQPESGIQQEFNNGWLTGCGLCKQYSLQVLRVWGLGYFSCRPGCPSGAPLWTTACPLGQLCPHALGLPGRDRCGRGDSGCLLSEYLDVRSPGFITHRAHSLLEKRAGSLLQVRGGCGTHPPRPTSPRQFTEDNKGWDSVWVLGSRPQGPSHL